MSVSIHPRVIPPPPSKVHTRTRSYAQAVRMVRTCRSRARFFLARAKSSGVSERTKVKSKLNYYGYLHLITKYKHEAAIHKIRAGR
jgi:hypothetical protein